MNWIEHSAWLEDSAYSIVPAAGTSFTFDDKGVFQSGKLTSNGWIPELDRLPRPVADLRCAHADGFDGARRGTAPEDHRLRIDRGVRCHRASVFQRRCAVRGSDGRQFRLHAQHAGEPECVGRRPHGQTAVRVRGLPAATWSSATISSGPPAWTTPSKTRPRSSPTRLSMAFNIDSGWFQTFKAGVRFADRKATNRDTGYNWQPISQWWQSDAQGNWPGHLASMDGLHHRQFHALRLFGLLPRERQPARIVVGRLGLAGQEPERTTAASVQSAWVNGAGWAPDSFQAGDTNVQQEEDICRIRACCGLARNWDRRRSTATSACAWCRTDYTRVRQRPAAGLESRTRCSTTTATRTSSQSGVSGDWLPNDFEDSYQDVLPSLNLRLKLNRSCSCASRRRRRSRGRRLDQLTANRHAGRRHLDHLPASGPERPERSAGTGGRGGDFIHGQRRQPLARARWKPTSSTPRSSGTSRRRARCTRRSSTRI